MKLIVGLGNPGDTYARTRHNAGFMALDHCHRPEWPDFKPAPKATNADAHVARLREETFGVPVLFTKPQTYMNRSGQAVRGLRDYYRIENQDVLVVYDDIDLPFATLRTRYGGSSGGHKGLESLISHCGEGFARLRVGIGNEHASSEAAEHFVLSKFTPTELTVLPAVLDVCTDVITRFIAGSLEATTQMVAADTE